MCILYTQIAHEFADLHDRAGHTLYIYMFIYIDIYLYINPESIETIQPQTGLIWYICMWIYIYTYMYICLLYI
jgi:hypothetical protein